MSISNIAPEAVRINDAWRTMKGQTVEEFLRFGERCAAEASAIAQKDDATRADIIKQMDISEGTFSKFARIGQNVERFRRPDVREKLPPSWPVLYELSLLTAEQFEMVLPYLTCETEKQKIERWSHGFRRIRRDDSASPSQAAGDDAEVQRVLQQIGVLGASTNDSPDATEPNLEHRLVIDGFSPDNISDEMLETALKALKRTAGRFGMALGVVDIERNIFWPINEPGGPIPMAR